MSGEAVAEWLLGRAVIFRMKDSDFLPEGAFDLQCHHISLEVREFLRSQSGYHGGDAMGACGSLVGEGAELDFDNGRDVGAGGDRLRVGEIELRGVGSGIELVGEPAGSGRFAEDGGDGCFQFLVEAALDGFGAGLIDFFDQTTAFA